MQARVVFFRVTAILFSHYYIWFDP